jgi:hypothetical protein
MCVGVDFTAKSATILLQNYNRSVMKTIVRTPERLVHYILFNLAKFFDLGRARLFSDNI